MDKIDRIINGFPRITQLEYDRLLHFKETNHIRGFLPNKLFRKRANLLKVVDARLYLHDDRMLMPIKRVNDLLNDKYVEDIYTSVDNMYSHIVQKYTGVSKRDVHKFLNKQEVYQLHKPKQNRRHITPILANYANQRHQIDLVDMTKFHGHNQRFKWILVIIDIHSRYVWVYKLKNKKAITVGNQIRIHYINNEWPAVIQSDNGGEFKNYTHNVITRYCKHIMSNPYKPHAQGIIERFNKNLKLHISTYMDMHNTKKWIDVVDRIVEKYNITKHGTTGHPPILAYYDETNQEEINQKVKDKANKTITLKPLNPLKKGDLVRINLETIPKYRRIKRFRKGYLSKWSKDVFIVYSISKGENKKFKLIDNNTNEKINKYYYRHELLKIPHNTQRYNPPIEDDEDDEDDVNPLDEVEHRDVAPIIPNIRQLRRPPDPLNLIGKRIKVYWPDRRHYYKGIVIEYRIGLRQYIVRYDQNTGLFEPHEEHDIFEDLETARYSIL